MDGFAGDDSDPQAIKDYLQEKIDTFAEEERNHEHIPAKDGIVYCPLKGKGTMPPPGWDTDADVP